MCQGMAPAAIQTFRPESKVTPRSADSQTMLPHNDDVAYLTLQHQQHLLDRLLATVTQWLLPPWTWCSNVVATMIHKVISDTDRWYDDMQAACDPSPLVRDHPHPDVFSRLHLPRNVVLKKNPDVKRHSSRSPPQQQHYLPPSPSPSPQGSSPPRYAAEAPF